jgi:hypothetical protein
MPKRKDICDCGILENASKEPDHAIRWDEQMNEYYIAYGNSGRMMVYYCPFCGGSTPESRRNSFFAHVTQQEEHRMTELFRGIRKVSDGPLSRCTRTRFQNTFYTGPRFFGGCGRVNRPHLPGSDSLRFA